MSALPAERPAIAELLNAADEFLNGFGGSIPDRHVAGAERLADAINTARRAEHQLTNALYRERAAWLERTASAPARSDQDQEEAETVVDVIDDVLRAVGLEIPTRTRSEA